MNQNAPIQNAPIGDPALARPHAPAAAAASSPAAAAAATLSPEGRALLRLLTEGDLSLARRKDLGDLYRRLQAAIPPPPADRTERLESALNRIDGALRIELAPLLKGAVEQALAEHRPAALRRRGVLLPVVLFVAGVLTGVTAAPELRDLAGRIAERAIPVIAQALPQIRGIDTGTNQVD